MRVLLIGINYAPEETGIGPYTAGLAEHLTSLGHDVDVVTGMPSYPAWRVSSQYRKRWSVKEVRNGVAVWRRAHYVPRLQSSLSRLAYEGTFLVGALTTFSLPRPDVIVGVVPSLSGGVAARTLAARFRVPFGLLFQDLVARAAVQSGVPGASRTASVVQRVERWIASRAASVGIVADGFRPYLESLGVSPDRIIRLRNWVRRERPTVDRRTIRKQFGWSEDGTVCLHAGNMGYKQNLTALIDSARLASHRAANVRFVLLGDGSQRPMLEARVARESLKNVQFLPLQPKGLFEAALQAADVLLVSQRASVGDMSLPSKLTAYFAAGRPVVAAVSFESEAATEVLRSGSGVLAPPDDPSGLLEVITQLVADPQRCTLLGTAGRSYARDVLDAGSVLPRLAAFVERLTENASRDTLGATA